MPAVAEPPYLLADLFLQALEDGNVDYIFAVLGSDHPSIIEAYARRRSRGKSWPRLLLFQHEMVAISAADGYGRLTHHPQCVLVHVDVGTSALGQGLHNAACGRAPMLIFAGLAPFTLHGEAPGSRSEHVQWMQDIPNQASIVAPYVNYANEIKSAHHVRMMVNRALLMATSGSPGPTYLTAAREILATPVDKDAKYQQPGQLPSVRIGVLPDDAVSQIGELLLFAEKPVVITGYLGRNNSAVKQLVQLANLIPGLRVIDTEFREMSFPADHPAWTTTSTGAPIAIQTADVILVLDSDVPWIPVKCKPSSTARIFHLDIDAAKNKMQLFDLFAQASFNSDCELALVKINHYISNHRRLAFRQESCERRRQGLQDAHAIGQHLLAIRALPKEDGSISSDHLFATVRKVLPGNTTYVHEAVTNTMPLFEQLQPVAPGSALAKGGSGLGWAGGASIGVKLALDKYDVAERPISSHRKQGETPDAEPFVCCITGDGSFMFGSPCATYWAQHRLNTPFLTIVLNNGGWRATRVAGVSDHIIGYDLTEDSPDYVGVAVAASNGRLWGIRVRNACDLSSALQTAVKVVKEEQRGALLEVVIS